MTSGCAIQEQQATCNSALDMQPKGIVSWRRVDSEAPAGILASFRGARME